jgi:hypothetical protein
VTTPPAGTSAAEVWASTWIPRPSPLEDFGNDAGYSVAWVRTPDSLILQVLVDADHAPPQGATGEVKPTSVGDDSIDVFKPSAEGAS